MISLFLPHSLIEQTAAEFSPFPKLPASSPTPPTTTAGKGKLYEEDLSALYESYELLKLTLKLPSETRENESFNSCVQQGPARVGF